MMYYYTVPVLGSGTDEDPYRPDAPPGVVGVHDGTEFLIASALPLAGKSGRVQQLPRAALEARAEAHGLTWDEVMSWWTRDTAEG